MKRTVTFDSIVEIAGQTVWGDMNQRRMRVKAIAEQ